MDGEKMYEYSTHRAGSGANLFKELKGKVRTLLPKAITAGLRPSP